MFVLVFHLAFVIGSTTWVYLQSRPVSGRAAIAPARGEVRSSVRTPKVHDYECAPFSARPAR